jgi:hypothetical protein
MLPFSTTASRSFKTPYRKKGHNRNVKKSQVALIFAAIVIVAILLNYHLLSSSSSTAAGTDATDADATLPNNKVLVQPQEDQAHSKAPEKVPPVPPTHLKPPQERNVKHPMTVMKKKKKHDSNNNDNKEKEGSPAPGYSDSTEANPYPYQGTVSATRGSPSAVQVLNQPLNDTTVKIIPMAEEQVSCKNTMVIAYFRVKSKYTPEKYDGWMANIFSMQDCMVVFTQPDMVETVYRLRAHAADRTVIVVQPDPNDLPVSQLYQQSHPHFWEDQLIMDKEAKRHRSYELFWIWLSKSWWVMQAIERNFFRSDFFMYSDIGCFRSAAWNGKKLIQHASIVPKNTVMWMAHHKPNPPAVRLWNDKFREKDHFYHSGSQGAGTAEAWRRFHQVFAETMDGFASNGLFIGEDQTILQSACLGSYDLAPISSNSSAVSAGVCTYAPFDQVPDNHYFGLRHVLHHGGNNYHFWKPPLGIKMTS